MSCSDRKASFMQTIKHFICHCQLPEQNVFGLSSADMLFKQRGRILPPLSHILLSHGQGP